MTRVAEMTGLKYVLVNEKTLLAQQLSNGELYTYDTILEAEKSTFVYQYVMSLPQYKNMREIQRIVETAGIVTDEPTFDDFLNKANEYMAVARDDGYYNAVMKNERVDEEAIVNDNIDNAIRVLQLAKQYAQKVGF